MAPKAKPKGTPAEPRAATRSTTPKASGRCPPMPGPASPEAKADSRPKTPQRHKELLDSVDVLPSKSQKELQVPKLLRSRSSPPKATTGSTFGSSKEENETVVGWVEHDTKIRNALPLNPTAEECHRDKALPLHPAAEAALSQGKRRRGVKRYAGISAQSSRVDQVIFGRDMDFTATGDDSDVKAYAGSAGLPSHFTLKAGGVKKIEGSQKDTGLVHTPLGVTVVEAEEPQRRKELRHPASPFCSPGMAEVFGEANHVEVARSPRTHPGAAGARPFRSPKADRPQETSRPTNLVAAVVFGGEGDVPQKSSVADSRKKRVDPTETFADVAGRISAELNEQEKRGKRLVAWRDSSSTSGSAGCPSSFLGDHLAGWFPEARDRLKKTAAGFEEPQRALNCVSDKVLYGRASPRQEPLWNEAKANVQRQVPGRKHLGTLGMPFMEQQADIFGGSKPPVRSVTPPPDVGRSPRSSAADPFNGSAGKPSTFAEWDLPRPSRSVTPPKRFPSEKVFGIPSGHDGARRVRGGGFNPAFGRSNVASLLCGE